jgi:hypothetical protein
MRDLLNGWAFAIRPLLVKTPRGGRKHPDYVSFALLVVVDHKSGRPSAGNDSKAKRGQEPVSLVLLRSN